MILTADYHTHTPYSHGKNTVAENAARAKELGLKQIGITDHGFSHLAFGLKRKQVAALKEDCKNASERLGIDVLVGMEANIRGISGLSDIGEKDYDDFDLYVCGKHVFVSYDKLSDVWHYLLGNFTVDKLKRRAGKKLIEYNTKAYIHAIEKNPIDVISHLGYLCPADVKEVAKCAADHGTYIELNSKKTHLTDEELFSLTQTDVRFVIGSDAHTASRVGDTAIVEEQLKRVDFPTDRIDNIDCRLPRFRFAAFKNGYKV